MADVTFLQQFKKGLIPYILGRKLINEKHSEKIGNGAYGTITKIKYCRTLCAAKEIHAALLPELHAGVSNVEHDEALSKVVFRKGNPESLIVEKFCAEIKILSEIRHPNFVQFIGVYFRETSPFPVLVMELMHTSLAHCLTQDKQKFPLSIKLFILQDVARALVYLHTQEPPILHRDLTANNVLLTPSMRAKLADLGMAKIMTIDMSKLTQCPGNVVYMPPEALKEHPSYGIEIDVYSYGVLGFHTFSGKWPNPQGSGSDSERCFVSLIGEGVCLKRTLEKCIDRDPEKRLKASETLIDVETVIKELEVEESDYLETYYVAQHTTKLVKEMSERVANLSRSLKSKQKYVQKLESDEQNLNTSMVLERLRCDNKEKSFAIELLEQETVVLNQELKTLRKVVDHQEINVKEMSNERNTQDHINSLKCMIDGEHETCQPCQYCSETEKKKKDLSNLVTSVQAQVCNLSSQIRNKDEQLLIKEKEIESKEKEIEQLNENFELVNAEIESVKVLGGRYMEKNHSIDSDIASLIDSTRIEQSKKCTKLLETVKVLEKQLSENDNRHKLIQNRYKMMLHDLCIPYKGILCSSPPCTILTCKHLKDVSLKPAEKISPIIQNIKKAPLSSFEGVIPAVYYDSKIFFLSEINYKKQKQSGIIWYDPLLGKFDVIRDQEIITFGHFGTTLLALAKDKQFFTLTDYAWQATSIPSLPSAAGDLQNPVILMYHSMLIIVNGNVVWVYNDSVCKWVQLELSVEKGDFEVSRTNSFAILADKLFVCISSQKIVYSVGLQQLIDITLSYSNSKPSRNCLSTQQDAILKLRQENQNVHFRIEDALDDAVLDEIPIPDNTGQSNFSKNVLKMNEILKGATFIFCHARNLLALHNTSSSVDKVWYYDAQCCHWHNVEYDSNDASSVMLKKWICLSNNCAGILELALPSAWTFTTSWGQAKLYEIQLLK